LVTQFNYLYDNIPLSTLYHTNDNLGRITKISGYFEQSNNEAGFLYDTVGNMTDIWAVNGIYTEFGYNSKNMVTGISSAPLSLLYTLTVQVAI